MASTSGWIIVGGAAVVLGGVLGFRMLASEDDPHGSPPPRSGSAHDDGLDGLDAPDGLDALDDDREGSGRDPVERLCQALECDAAQRQAVEQVAVAHARRAAELRRDIKDLRAPLGPLLQGEAPDESAIRQVASDLAEPRRALDDAALAAILAVHAVLGPAQRQKLARMVVRRGPVAVLEGARKRGQGPSAAAD